MPKNKIEKRVQRKSEDYERKCEFRVSNYKLIRHDFRHFLGLCIIAHLEK